MNNVKGFLVFKVSNLRMFVCTFYYNSEKNIQKNRKCKEKLLDRDANKWYNTDNNERRDDKNEFESEDIRTF